MSRLRLRIGSRRSGNISCCTRSMTRASGRISVLLREVLTAYAKKMFGSKSPNELVGTTEEQFITTTFELYEQGDIRLWRLDNGWKIEPCQPGEAPQLNTRSLRRANKQWDQS